MPVHKYRSIYEMPDETWREPGDPVLYRAIRQVWDFGQRTSKRRYRPGVYKFRSIEEMDAALDALLLPNPPAGDKTKP